MKDRSMIILYFFDVDSRPSREGLLNLRQPAKHYQEAEMTVWAIILSSGEKVEKLIERAKSGGGFDNITVILCEVVG